MLKLFIVLMLKKYGWVVAAKIVGELLTRDIIEFRLEAKNEAQKGVFDVAARVIRDGWIDRDEIVAFMRSFKPVIPGWIDDMIIEALCMFLNAGENFRWGTAEKPELFEAVSDALKDQIFHNRELGTILLETI
tara:strand:- start:11 stop:409 length:399 start_codon:yes stop_codon:yes gene_type:complete